MEILSREILNFMNNPGQEEKKLLYYFTGFDTGFDTGLVDSQPNLRQVLMILPAQFGSSIF